MPRDNRADTWLAIGIDIVFYFFAFLIAKQMGGGWPLYILAAVLATIASGLFVSILELR
jgi:hypothetical protein